MANMMRNIEEDVAELDYEDNISLIQNGNDTFSTRFRAVIDRLQQINHEKGAKRIKSKTGEHVKQVMFSQALLADIMGRPEKSISEWKNGKVYPGKRNQQEITDALKSFGVRKEYLACESAIMLESDYLEQVDFISKINAEYSELSTEQRIEEALRVETKHLLNIMIPLLVIDYLEEQQGRKLTTEEIRKINAGNPKYNRFAEAAYDISSYIEYRLKREMADIKSSKRKQKMIDYYGNAYKAEYINAERQ